MSTIVKVGPYFNVSFDTTEKLGRFVELLQDAQYYDEDYNAGYTYKLTNEVPDITIKRAIINQ